jgi:tRNA (mo5U34)-methyltransferase
MSSPEELQQQADAIAWYHTIELGHGVVTKGLSDSPHHAEILPDIRDKSVLDIGAWDGKFSFLAEQRGAARVVALDHYAWGVDIEARDLYWNECAANGTLPNHSRDLIDFWHPELPGQRGFTFASQALSSKVQPLVADFTTVDLNRLGRFDVVLYLGVLYHMPDPMASLERVCAVTKEVAVIETEAVHLHGFDSHPLLQFHVGSSLRADFGNWFVPTLQALTDMCLAAGFTSVKTVKGYPLPKDPPSPEGHRAEIARKIGRIPRTDHLSAETQAYRAVVHAYI